MRRSISSLTSTLTIIASTALFSSCGGGGQSVLDTEPMELPNSMDSPSVEQSIECVEACGQESDQVTAFIGRLNSETIDLVVDGGLNVILKRTPGNPIVAVRLFIDGGCRDLTAENAGIARLAFSVATSGGTETLTKPEFAASLNSMGSSIGSFTDLDYSGLTLSSVSFYFDETWALFQDMLLNPGFPDSEVNLEREQLVQSIRMRTDNPDSRVVDLARSLLFADHCYANAPRGTEESVSGMTRDDLVDFYSTAFDNSRMLLVVVGDITEDALVELIGDTFAGFESSAGRPASPEPFTVDRAALEVVSEEIPTNYIIGLSPAPAPTDDDYPALVLTIRRLHDRLFEEVRTIRNLTYAVSAGLSSRLANYSYLYVTAVDPGATMPVMFAEVDRLSQTPLTQSELEDIMEVYITSHYTGMDSNGAVASELGWWQMFGGGRANADQFISRLRAVTPEDIQRVAAQYLTNYQFGVVGNPETVPAELFEGVDP